MTFLITLAVLAAVFAPPIAVAGHRLRRRMVARALADRVGIEMLPANSFNPGEEDIRRHAVALARVRPASGRFVPLSTRAVTIRLTSDDGQIHYQIWGPRTATSVLRGRTYGGVELKLLTPLAVEESEQPEPEQPGETRSAIPDLMTRISQIVPAQRPEPKP